MMKKNTVQLRLTLDVEYNPVGVSVETLKNLLAGVVSHATDSGLLTGETPATVEKWSHTVSIPQNPRVVVVVDGGLVQQVIADHEVEVLVVDYDTEGSDGESIVQIPQGNGSFSNACGGQQSVEINPAAVECLTGAYQRIMK